jgi:putative ATP-dependent endonuclease of the OLD family
MARIRKIEIAHFRGIQKLSWVPAPGVNCLIGPGDSGKSTVLEAIDLCLGARRNAQFTDVDFYNLDVEVPITIEVTVGELDDGLKNIEQYGLYARNFDPATGEVEDEPEKDAEMVLTVRLAVASDLEPVWSLVSARAEAQGQSRNLAWNDRIRLAPTRIGVMADYHLGWSRGSVLNRVSEERADASAALAKAARDARAGFGNDAEAQLSGTLKLVTATAKDLGIPVGKTVKAMLDAHSVSFTGGAISLHDEDGVPLRGLGTGSARLLVSGLQRKAAEKARIILVDELEYGLEPHRIIRLLGSLGAKEKTMPLQVFMTTHSPVALCELSGEQLFVLRYGKDEHIVHSVGAADDVQGTIRVCPNAFLATAVIVCEGASEVGLVRGFDQIRCATGAESIHAQGVALVDSGGGDPDRAINRARALLALGYRVAVLRDDDKKPDSIKEKAFLDSGGEVVTWPDGLALEDELFLSVSDDAVLKLLERAEDLHGAELINEHIKTGSRNTRDLNAIMEEGVDSFGQETRQFLGKVSRSKNNSWFKTVGRMEDVARDIIGPDIEKADKDFRQRINQLFAWVSNA